jgi:hypothetical protein
MKKYVVSWYHGFVFVLFFVKILDHKKYITFFVSFGGGFWGVDLSL